LRQLLLQLLQCLRLQRWRALFRWQRWLLRWLHWRPLWLLRLLWSLRLLLPGLRLVLSPLLSVEPVLQVCPRPVPLLPIHFARRWLLPLPLLPLQQPLLPMQPVEPLCRLSSLHWLSPLQLPM
jgi:hypothetical protein